MALSALLLLSQKRAADWQERFVLPGLRRILAAPGLQDRARSFLTPVLLPVLPLVGKELAGVVADRSRPAAERLAAFELLRRAMEDNPNLELRPGLAESFRTAKEGLLWQLEDPAADPRIQDFLRANLSKLEPEAVLRLQESSHIPVSGIPPVEALQNERFYPVPDEDLVRRAAIGATPEQALAAFKADDVSHALAAAFLAPELARRSGWEPLAEAMFRWLPSDRIYELRRKDQRHRIEVRRAFAETFVVIVEPAARAGDAGARELLLRAFNRLLEDDPHERDAWTGLYRYTDSLNALLPREFPGLIRGRFRDPKLAATLRLRAWVICRRFADKKDSVGEAAALMADPKADPGLRALLGSLFLKYEPTALDGMLDKSAVPWKLKPGAPGDLPVSEPDDEVPTECLAASVGMLPDAKTLRSAAAALRNRFRIRAPEEAASALGFRDLARRQGFPLLAALRAAAEGSDPAAVVRRPDSSPVAATRRPSLPAAELLALLGEPADIDRIALAAVSEGLWAPWPFLHTEWSETNALLNGYDSVNAVGAMWSTLDPYIHAGFGPAADRVRARLLFALARKHEREQRADRAKKTFAQAYRLDPFLR